jgi:hypothetical protein
MDTISLLLLVAINAQAAVPETSPSVDISTVLGSVAFAAVVGSGALAKVVTTVRSLANPKRAARDSGTARERESESSSGIAPTGTAPEPLVTLSNVHVHGPA